MAKSNRSPVWALSLLLTLLLFSCRGAQKPDVAAVPPPPVPPSEPWAWLPDDGTFVGQLVLEPFRTTPLWSLWENARKDQQALGKLIDPDKIERAVFAGVGRQQETPSFVAALIGKFGEGSVAARAARNGIASEQQGLLVVYRYDDVAVAQVYPELIVACSLDRLEWLAARSSEGPAIKVHESALYRSLAPRLSLSAADFAMIAEDPSGDAKALAESQGQRFGINVSATDLVRGGLSIDLGASTKLSAVVETTGEEPAQALQKSVEETLRQLSSNIFVGLLGLRPLVSQLHAKSEGAYVEVGGSVQQEVLNRALERVAGMLGVALSGGGVVLPSATP